MLGFHILIRITEAKPNPEFHKSGISSKQPNLRMIKENGGWLAELRRRDLQPFVSAVSGSGLKMRRALV